LPSAKPLSSKEWNKIARGYVNHAFQQGNKRSMDGNKKSNSIRDV
jgi:hypothetical protein